MITEVSNDRSDDNHLHGGPHHARQRPRFRHDPGALRGTGSFADPTALLDLVARGASWSQVETEIGQLIGPSGFVALSRLDQGALLSLHGKPVEATQYLVGNPLIARQIIDLNATAALHAPFPVAIYRDDQGVHVAYAQPSSSFGSLGSADIDLIAKELDARILSTVEQVCRT